MIVLASAQALVVILLVWIAFRTTDIERLMGALRSASLLLLLGAFLTLVVERVARPCRLAVLLEASSPFEIVAAQSVSQLANLVLPMRSGEMLLVLLLRSLTPVAGSYVLSIIVVDRLLDVVFVLFVFTMAVAVIPSLPPLANYAALLLGAACVVIIALLAVIVIARARIIAAAERWRSRLVGGRGERWVKRLEFIIEGFAVLLDPRRIAVAIGVTAATWILATVATWMVLQSIWPGAPIGAAALAICLGVIGTTLISVPAGVGVTHAAYALAVVAYGGTQEVGLAFAIAAHFFASLATVGMGLVSLRIVRRKRGGIPLLKMKLWG